MRFLISVMGTAVVLTVVSSWSASLQTRYVVPVKNDVAAFGHNPKTTGEQPVFVAGPGDWLMALEWRGDMVEVSDLNGNVGWIENALVKKTTMTEAVTFSDATVLAYLDNPTPVYILDAANPFDKSIFLDRSFSQELSDNVDQETIERIVGKNAAR